MMLRRYHNLNNDRDSVKDAVESATEIEPAEDTVETNEAREEAVDETPESKKTKKKTENYYDFIKHYIKEVCNTGIFLLPHHGANNNWNSRILCNFICTLIFLNSSGLNNRFKHPGSMVIKELQKKRKIVCCANEYLTVEYYI